MTFKLIARTMVSFLWIILASIFNALMDILENENFYASRFAHLNEKFWYKRESWKFAKKILGYKIDGWHLAKSAMICIILIPIAQNFKQYVLLGLTWNITFIIFYKLFKGPAKK